MHNNHLQYEMELTPFPLDAIYKTWENWWKKENNFHLPTIFPKKKRRKFTPILCNQRQRTRVWLGDLFIQMDGDIIAMKISQAKISIENESRKEEYHSCENRLGFAASGIYNPEQMQLDGLEGNGKSILPNSRRQRSFWRNNIAVLVPTVFLCC